MFCSNCGQQNSDNGSFCIQCGQSLQMLPSAPEISGKTGSLFSEESTTRSQHASPSPRTDHKGKAGFIIALAISGLVLISALLILFLGVIPMLNKESGDRGIETTEAVAESAIIGLWSNEDIPSVVKFKMNGDVTIFNQDESITGTYEYDEKKEEGVISLESGDFEFVVSENEIDIDEAGDFTKVDDKDFDIQEFIDDNRTTTTTAAATTAAATTAAAETTQTPLETTKSIYKTYAIIVKNDGNPYNMKEAEGFQKVIEEAGGTCIIKAPSEATAEAQITMINELIAQQVDAIAIAGNDADALQSALKLAMDAGIKVLSLDSSVNKDSRLVHINQAGTVLVGKTLAEAVADIAGPDGGQFAILSATSQATNQNAWIDAMKDALSKDSHNLELVKIAYGDDEFQKSVDETEALIKNYPDLKVICAPTTVGMMAAGKVLTDKGLTATIKLTGLGLPSEMADYIGADKACPYMFLWNPLEIGALAAYTAIALVDGSITGKAGETFTAGTLGDKKDGKYTIVAAADGGTEIILGSPFKFDPSNITEWKTVY